MHKYKLTVNDLEAKIISSTSELKNELEGLRTKNGLGLSFVPDPALNDLIEFGTLTTSRKKGVFRKKLVTDYYLELNFKYHDGKTGLCGYNTYDFCEIKDMIINLVDYQKLPDISSWVMTKWGADGKGLSFDESNPNLKLTQGH